MQVHLSSRAAAFTLCATEIFYLPRSRASLPDAPSFLSPVFAPQSYPRIHNSPCSTVIITAVLKFLFVSTTLATNLRSTLLDHAFGAVNALRTTRFVCAHAAHLVPAPQLPSSASPHIGTSSLILNVSSSLGIAAMSNICGTHSSMYSSLTMVRTAS